jgi:hypothetical protein
VFRFIARQKQPSRSPESEDAVVGAGIVERVLVDRERFVSQARHE